MFDWYWRRVRQAVSAEATGLVTAAEDRMGRRLDDVRVESERAATAILARWHAVDRRLDGLLVSVDRLLAGVTRLEALACDTHDRLDVGFDRLHEASGQVADRVESQGRQAIERVFDSPVTYWGGQLALWMASPAGEAVRYAVRKSALDPSLHDNDLRRREAVQWSRHWLREHGHAFPPDSQLGLMIEAAVLEGKTGPVPDGR